MIFLPIVERELRVASRKRSTFWARVIAAFVALLMGSGFLVLTTVGFGFGTPSLGRGLFAALTWLSLAAALSAGLFFTSDCLSEEKREGTIGFLFLTDLQGYDVVLGKLLATSLRGFYALLAVFPILAVTLLMGGVTGAQFWKTSLALANAMFVSLATGLFVSAISRDSQRALAATLLLLLLLIAAGPASDAILAAMNRRNFNPIFSLSSPGYLFVTAGAWGRGPFWSALLVNQAVVWLLIALACHLVPRTWQERTAKVSRSDGGWAHRWRFGGAERQAALRRKLVSVNPVLWLACRERWQANLLWGVTILLVGGLAATFVADEEWLWYAWSYFDGAFLLLLWLAMASQAGRFFVEAQRSGLLQLLLATPLTVRQIVQGQWRAFVRMFGVPLMLYLVAQMIGTFMVQRQTWSNFLAATPPAPPAATSTTNTTVATNAVLVTTTTGTRTMVSVGGGVAAPSDLVALAVSVMETLPLLTGLAALIWFGMWMGLNSKNNSLATLKTILFVQVIPWFVILFASALIVPLVLLPSLMRGTATAAALLMAWGFPLLTSGMASVLYLIKDVAFVLWTRRKLYSEFRERASRVVAPIWPAQPLPLAEKGPPPTSLTTPPPTSARNL
jgi:hypothetical protein